MSNPFFLFPGFDLGGAAPESNAPVAAVDFRAAAEAEGIRPDPNLDATTAETTGRDVTFEFVVQQLLAKSNVEAENLHGLSVSQNSDTDTNEFGLFAPVADVLPPFLQDGSPIGEVSDVSPGSIDTASLGQLASESPEGVGDVAPALSELDVDLSELEDGAATGLLGLIQSIASLSEAASRHDVLTPVEESLDASSVSETTIQASAESIPQTTAPTFDRETLASVSSLLIQTQGTDRSATNALVFESAIQQSFEIAAVSPNHDAELVKSAEPLIDVGSGFGGENVLDSELVSFSQSDTTFAELPDAKTATKLQKDAWFVSHFQSSETPVNPAGESVEAGLVADYDALASVTNNAGVSSAVPDARERSSGPLDIKPVDQTSSGSQDAMRLPQSEEISESLTVERDRVLQVSHPKVDPSSDGTETLVDRSKNLGPTKRFLDTANSKSSQQTSQSSAPSDAAEARPVDQATESKLGGETSEQTDQDVGKEVDFEPFDESLLDIDADSLRLNRETGESIEVTEPLGNAERFRIETNSALNEDSGFSTPLAQKAVEPAFTLTSDASALGVSIHQELVADAVAADRFAEETIFFEEALAIDELLADSAADGLDSAADVLLRAAETSLRQEGRTIQLELSPAELGTLRIQVLQTEHSIETQIVASEAVASELLNAHREQLTAALQSLGFETSDVEISHQPSQDAFDDLSNSADQADRDSQRREVFSQRRSAPYLSPTQPGSQTSADDSAGGLNLIA